MEYLNKLKKDIQVYFGSRGHIKDHVPGMIGDLLNPSKLCFFFKVSMPEELDEIRTLLSMVKFPGRQITAYVFSYGYERLDVITHQSIFYFDLNDFSLLGEKKEELKNRFAQERYDILVSFLFDLDPFCLKLVSELKAEFKIGPVLSEMNGVYDLTIKHEKDLFTFQSFYDEVLHYLKILNINVR